MRNPLLVLLSFLLLTPCLGAEFPWDDVDSLIKLELDTRRFNVPSPEELVQRGCSPEQIERGRQFARLQPSQLTRTILSDLLRPKERREAALSPKTPHHSYLLGRILMLKLLREEAAAKKISPTELIEKAIATGDMEASAWQTGNSFWNTRLEKTDWNAGWTTLNPAAEKGNAQAYYLLATYYAVKNFAYSKFTRSFVPDVDKTGRYRTWMCKSAELGYPDAMLQCGNLLYVEKGQARDLPTAEKWLNKAAELGLSSNGIDSLKCVVPVASELCPVCESLREKSETTPPGIPKKFAGVYSFKESGEAPQYLVLKVKGDSLFLGAEDFGEHGRAYFGVAVEDLRVTAKGEIEFRVANRFYYDIPFKPTDPIARKSKSKGAGHTEMFFKGQIKDGHARLTCKGDCSRTMDFAQ